MTVKKSFCALLLLCSAVLLLSSCRYGRLLTVKTDGRFEFRAWGSDDGIRSVEVTENGKVTADLTVSAKRAGHAFSDGDGLDYGLTVCDIDLDGATDIAVMTSNFPGSEKYVFFFGDGNGSFKKNEKLSDFLSPVFGQGDGLIAVSSVQITVDRTPGANPDAPLEYTEKHVTEYYGRQDGKIKLVRVRALTFYSENDIYCLGEYIPDPDMPDGLDPVSEIWIHPEDLEKHGLSPFPPYTE